MRQQEHTQQNRIGEEVMRRWRGEGIEMVWSPFEKVTAVFGKVKKEEQKETGTEIDAR